MTPTFTVNLGLRWEYFNPLTEKSGNLYEWIPAPATSPFAGGQIKYELGGSSAYNSYARDAALATGINAAPNLPTGQTISVYAVPSHFPIAYAYIYSLETDFNFAKNYVFMLGYQEVTTITCWIL